MGAQSLWVKMYCREPGFPAQNSVIYGQALSFQVRKGVTPAHTARPLTACPG